MHKQEMFVKAERSTMVGKRDTEHTIVFCQGVTPKENKTRYTKKYQIGIKGNQFHIKEDQKITVPED